jgi:hypothetical protein
MARAVRFSDIVPILSVLVVIIVSPALASEGTITVVTVPERVEVWIDNNYAGLSPIRDKRLAVGSYTIRLVDPAQQAGATEVVVIRPGEHVLLERTLSARFGKLRIDTDPPGAGVAIVAELGKTPLVNDFMTPGIYKVEIRPPRPNYLPATEEITFTDGGQPVTISHKFSKPPLLTKKRGIQLALGAAAAAGWIWAIIEHGTSSSTRVNAIILEENNPDEADRLWQKSNSAATRRTAAIITASLLSTALQVTIFIW